MRADLEALPDLLRHAERLLEDGTLATSPANAATLQVLSSVRLLDSFSEIHAHIGQSSCAHVARELFPDYPGPMPPFLPTAWLEPLARAWRLMPGATHRARGVDPAAAPHPRPSMWQRSTPA